MPNETSKNAVGSDDLGDSKKRNRFCENKSALNFN